MAIGALTGTGQYPSSNAVLLEWTNTGGDGDIWVDYDNNGWVRIYTLSSDATSQLVSTDNNTSYDFRVKAQWQLGWSSVTGIGNWQVTKTETVTPSESASEDIGYSDTNTETVTVSASGVEVSTQSDTCIETVTVSDSASAAAVSPLETTFRYYLGSFEGKVYSEREDVYSDDGTAIDAIWESKDLDFGDMFPELIDRDKTLYKVRLTYTDKTSDTEVDIGASTNGGTTWATRTKSIGTGDGTTKDAEFYFVLTGTYLRFRIRNNSTTDQFQWTRLVPFVVDAGADS